MKSRVLYPRLSLHVQPDGSLLALGEDLPVCIVAADEGDLEQKLLGVGRSVDAFLKGLDSVDAVRFIEERGIRYVVLGMADDADDHRSIAMPVSV